MKGRIWLDDVLDNIKKKIVPVPAITAYRYIRGMVTLILIMWK
jgi:hypothetical protein